VNRPLEMIVQDLLGRGTSVAGGREVANRPPASTRGIGTVPRSAPPFVAEITLEARDTDDGTEWYIVGRGPTRWTYSIWAADAEIYRRMTANERAQLNASRRSPSEAVRRVTWDRINGYYDVGETDDAEARLHLRAILAAESVGAFLRDIRPTDDSIEEVLAA
jgi:hypothetical protein